MKLDIEISKYVKCDKLVIRRAIIKQNQTSLSQISHETKQQTSVIDMNYKHGKLHT